MSQPCNNSLLHFTTTENVFKYWKITVSTTLLHLNSVWILSCITSTVSMLWRDLLMAGMNRRNDSKKKPPSKMGTYMSKQKSVELQNIWIFKVPVRCSVVFYIQATLHHHSSSIALEIHLLVPQTKALSVHFLM